MTSEPTHLGVLLADLRDSAAMSLAKAAKLIGCSKAHLWDLESGRAVNPTIKLLSSIARVYNCDLGRLAVVAAGATPNDQ